MATVARKPRTVKPVTGTCRLTLSINGTDYAVIPLRPHPEVAGKAVRLRKPDGTAYDVAVTEHGAECSCPDWIYNRDGKDPKGCKHVAACRACRLL
jgi:hypothetical protein